MGNAASNPFTVQVTAPAAVSQPGDAIPALSKLVALDGAVWTRVGAAILRNGVDTRCPYAKVEHLYINQRDAAWLASAGQPDAVWVADTDHGYAWYDHKTGAWGWTGHGPDGAFF